MTPDDLDDMATLLGDPQVMRYYPHPKNRQEALAWIAWNQRLYRERGVGLWLLTLRASGEFVGDCGLTPHRSTASPSWRSATTSGRRSTGSGPGHRGRDGLLGLRPRRPGDRPADRHHRPP
jgi:RimJ/RimL family protein N-acetyltransferase